MITNTAFPSWQLLFGNQIYPDTIVEFSDDGEDQYEWVVEFQCTDAGAVPVSV